MSWSVPGALAIVCPRYGEEVLGGAERVVRDMAERLAARGLPTEILTTCALDHMTWENWYPPGTQEINGVTVRRFHIEQAHGPEHRAIGERIGAGMPTSLEEQERWLNEQFRSAGLFHYLMQEHRRYHTILLTPYMFWTTYACAQIAPHKNVLRPCLHDEGFARLEVYRPQFRDARGILFNSPPEVELARRLFDLPRRWELAEEGMDVPASYDAERFRSTYGVPGQFALYSGRRESGKNVDGLIELFVRFVERTGADLKLLIGGRGEIRIPAGWTDRIVDLGFLPEQDKNDAFAAATVVCQPSPAESFARMIMDSWLAQTPVIGYGGCSVTAYHVEQSGAGLVYNDATEFEVALELLLESPDLRRQMGTAGRAYVLERYTWDRAIDALAGAIDRWSVEDVA